MSIIAPMSSASANAGSNNSSFHSIVWGYSGGKHFTSVSMRYERAMAQVITSSGMSHTVFAPSVGGVARAEVAAIESTPHSHIWGSK